MKIKQIDHIGIAVRDLDLTSKFYTEILGLCLHGVEEVEEQNAKVAFLPITDSEIELLESTDSKGTIAKYIGKKGEGIHHLAFRVENIEEALEELKAKNIKLIDEKPRIGAGNAKIAFIHPKETNGVLVELCQRD